jgi:hypothetical protein
MMGAGFLVILHVPGDHPVAPEYLSKSRSKRSRKSRSKRSRKSRSKRSSKSGKSNAVSKVAKDAEYYKKIERYKTMMEDYEGEKETLKRLLKETKKDLSDVKKQIAKEKNIDELEFLREMEYENETDIRNLTNEIEVCDLNIEDIKEKINKLK